MTPDVPSIKLSAFKKLTIITRVVAVYFCRLITWLVSLWPIGFQVKKSRNSRKVFCGQSFSSIDLPIKSLIVSTKLCSSNNATGMKILTEVFTIKKFNVVYSKLCMILCFISSHSRKVLAVWNTFGESKATQFWWYQEEEKTLGLPIPTALKTYSPWCSIIWYFLTSHIQELEMTMLLSYSA